MNPLSHFRKNISLIEERLKYRFKDKSLLELAFTHPSFAHGQRDHLHFHNERLEFLGDAILDFIISDFLYREFPYSREGMLTQLRASVVMTSSLINFLSKLHVGEFIILGKSEALQAKRDIFYANLFEAIIGAIYLDGGEESVRQFFFTHYRGALESIVLLSAQNPKTKLQEWAQKKMNIVPEYEVVEEKGPEHQKSFLVKVSIQGKEYGRGEGNSKKEAEVKAAINAFKRVSS